MRNEMRQEVLLERQHQQEPRDEHDLLRGEHVHALLLKLRAQAAGEVPQNAGRLAHAALLHWFASVDATLAAQLHMPNRRRPFTCSPLWSSGRESRDVGQRENARLHLIAGNTYWLRVTLLGETLFRSFMMRYQQEAVVKQEESSISIGELPRIQLGKVLFDVLDVATSLDDQMRSEPFSSWSGHTTYATLREHAKKIEVTSRVARKIGFEFRTPTGFSDGQGAWKHKMYLVPDAERVFDNLARTWNIWAPPHFVLDRKAIQEYCREWVTISDYALSTQTFHLGEAVQKGFVGTCVYTFMEAMAKSQVPSASQDALDVGAGLTPLQALHLLGAFAFYAGVGTKTAMGMGQTRPFVPCER